MIDSDGRQEAVGVRNRAEMAVGKCRWVLQVTTVGVDVGRHVSATRLVLRRLEHKPFVSRTERRRHRQARCQKTFGEVGERIGPVHKYPETGHGGWGREDAAENQHHKPQDTSDIRRCFGRRDARDHQV